MKGDTRSSDYTVAQMGAKIMVLDSLSSHGIGYLKTMISALD